MVETSSRHHAGTDANVWIQLINKFNENTPGIPLRHEIVDPNKDLFEMGG